MQQILLYKQKKPNSIKMYLANRQKRMRSQNWESSDKILLRQLVTEHIHVVENKNVDTNTSRRKRDAWKKILQSFNQASSTRRSLAQIQCQWRSTKMQAKARISQHQREVNVTADGPPAQSPNREDFDLVPLIQEEFETDCKIYDCDAAVEHVEFLNKDDEEPVCVNMADAENEDSDDSDVAPAQQKERKCTCSTKKRAMTSEQMKAELFELTVRHKKEEHQKRMEILEMEMVHKEAENARREKEELLAFIFNLVFNK